VSDHLEFLKSDDPFKIFENWFLKAKKEEQNPTAFTLSTVDENNFPDARTLLLKDVEDEKFLFFTSYLSKKFNDLSYNSLAAMTFYWHVSGVQVRIRGNIIKASEEVSKAYFESRAKESQVASLISRQSEVIESREALVSKFNETLDKYKNDDVPYPSFWGGLYLEPQEFTFFIYGEHRLNDRFNFQKENGIWICKRLQP
tara:strand:- start:1571 stop:2170 length:600 start_codon:yes stop_codon:yes gene_type:complete